MKEVLFSGKDVEVRYNGDIKNKYNVIVFRCAGNLPIILKDGTRIEPSWPYFMNFEDVFVSEHVNEIYIEPFHQHMYQTEEMKDAIRSIKKVLSPYSINVTFGLSMGGFGAINFCEELNAKFIALSPSATHTGILPISKKVEMYCLDYNIPPSNIELGKCIKCNGYLFFDYYHMIDRKHAYYIKEKTNAVIINEPFWGHSNADKLNECINIKELVYLVLENKFSVKDFKRRIKNAYYKNPHIRYIKFIISKFLKSNKTDVISYINHNIDIKSIKNLINISSAFIEINEYKHALVFLEKAYLINKKNSKVINLLNVCYLNIKNIHIYADCSIFDEVCSDKSKKYKYGCELLNKGNVNEALNIFSYLVEKYPDDVISFKYMIKSIEYLYGSKSAFDIIDSKYKKYNDNIVSGYRDGLYMMCSINSYNIDIDGCYIYASNSIYKIVKKTIGQLVLFSFINYKTGRYLRHCNGLMKESIYSNDEIFQFDSSFFVTIVDNKKILIQCSNPNLLCWFVSNDNDICRISRFDKKNGINHLLFDVFTMLN